jgi:hypothetical protein
VELRGLCGTERLVWNLEDLCGTRRALSGTQSLLLFFSFLNNFAPVTGTLMKELYFLVFFYSVRVFIR